MKDPIFKRVSEEAMDRVRMSPTIPGQAEMERALHIAVMEHKEALIMAFMAETGCLPSQVVLTSGPRRMRDGSMRYCVWFESKNDIYPPGQ